MKYMLDGLLLDVLAARMGCMYLSDLKYLYGWKRVQLGRLVEKIPAEAACCSSWNDTLHYLAEAIPAASAEEARSKLLNDLFPEPREPTWSGLG